MMKELLKRDNSDFGLTHLVLKELMLLISMMMSGMVFFSVKLPTRSIQDASHGNLLETHPKQFLTSQTITLSLSELVKIKTLDLG